MPDNVAAWIKQQLKDEIERRRAASDLVQEQIRRSHRQLIISYRLLQMDVPKTWPRPERSPIEK